MSASIIAESEGLNPYQQLIFSIIRLAIEDATAQLPPRPYAKPTKPKKETGYAIVGWTCKMEEYRKLTRRWEQKVRTYKYAIVRKERAVKWLTMQGLADEIQHYQRLCGLIGVDPNVLSQAFVRLPGIDINQSNKMLGSEKEDRIHFSTDQLMRFAR